MQFLRMSAQDFRQMMAGEKKPVANNKFHAQKTTVDGVTYDSKKESQRAAELQYLEKIGQIKDLRRQEKFVLQEDYTNSQGKKIRPIFYMADFVYYDVKKKKYIVEDVKSPATRTQVYKLKKKIFEYRYPEYIFIES